MAVLSDQDIQKALAAGRLIIEPMPDEKAYGTMSVDLRAGDELYAWKGLQELASEFGEVPSIQVGAFDFAKLKEKYLKTIKPDDQGCVTIGPESFLIGYVLELIGFPAEGQLAGRVEGRSRLARLGLSVHFAPTIHTGFRGRIMLEYHNVGPAPLKLKLGDYVCQLIVETVSSPPSGTMDGALFQDQGS